MTFGERIYNMRCKKKLTQDELAKRVGYRSRSTIAKIESGERDASQSMIVSLAKALDTTPSVLMGWDEWDKEAENFEATLNADNEKLMSYIKSRFNEEDVEKVYEIIIGLQNLNSKGLTEILKRIDELSRLEEYENDIIKESRQLESET